MSGDADQDWYLRDWAERLGKKQADLVTELGWHKNAAHRIWHGRQPYRRDILNQVARWLDLKPYELLMPPEEAEAIRQVRAGAAIIVAPPGSGASPSQRPRQAKSRTGTQG